MKFWKWLRTIGSCLFIALLVTLWWAHDPTSRPSGNQSPSLRAAPTIVR
jgi:hypothetical protein